MAQIILGVDIGSYSVKIAQVERTFGEFKLVNFFEVPLVAEEVLTDFQAASAALSKFLSDNPINYDSCVLSIPGQMVSNRVINLPFSNPKKIDQTLEFELETLIPFDIDETLFDYSIIQQSEQSSKVLATYLPEESFKKFLEQVQHSGLDPRYVGTDSLDLSYLAQTGALPPQGKYALLDLGHTKSNFVIMEGTQVKLVRSFSWGGDRLTRAIEKAGNLDYESAESYKHNKGAVKEKGGDEIQKVIFAEFQNLGLQIRQTLFAFYESGETPIEALYLSGGSSKISGIESFFSHLLNINVSALDVLEDSFTLLHDRERARAVIPTAFGAALHGIFPNKGAKINFRRGEYAYKKDIEELGGSLKKIGVLAASVVGIGIIYFFISYFTLSSQVDNMNKNISKIVNSSVKGLPKKGIKSTKSALSMLNGKISEIDEKLKKVQGDSSMSALQILKMVSAAMPPREQLVIDIDDINISPNRVRLEGRTGSYEAVDKVKASLEKIHEFQNVQTGNVRKGVRDEIKFSLSFDIIEGEGSS